MSDRCVFSFTFRIIDLPKFLNTEKALPVEPEWTDNDLSIWSGDIICIVNFAR